VQQEHSLNLEWTLHGSGSAKFSWTLATETVQIYTSYLGDALGGLLRAALDLDLGSSATIAVLLGEPGGYRIFFSGATREVYVQIVKFDDLHTIENRWKGGELRWERRISTIQFIDAVQRMAENVLQKYGRDGYRSTWGAPFPIEQLTMLKEHRSKPSDEL
jgi:hypothetical protein